MEGATDAAVARTLIRVGGGIPGIERVVHGKSKFNTDLPKYNAAAAQYPWLAIRDLDHDADCAPTLVGGNLPTANPLMCFRVAVREAEAWLMADREAFADALGVPLARIPTEPEALADPKQSVVNIARRSRRRAVRIGLVPEQGAGISVGPEYSAWMIDFAHNTWNPVRAARKGTAPSLVRGLAAVEKLVADARRHFGMDI